MDLSEIEKKIKDLENQLIPLQHLNDLELRKPENLTIPEKKIAKDFHLKEKKIRILKKEIRVLKENLKDLESNPSNRGIIEKHQDIILEKEKELQELIQPGIPVIESFSEESDQESTEKLLELKETIETELEFLQETWKIKKEQKEKETILAQQQENKKKLIEKKALERRKMIQDRKLKMKNKRLNQINN